MLSFFSSIVNFVQDSLNYVRPSNLIKASKFYVYSFIFLSKHSALFPVVTSAAVQAVDLISNGAVNADALVAAPYFFNSSSSSPILNLTTIEILSGGTHNPYSRFILVPHGANMSTYPDISHLGYYWKVASVDWPDLPTNRSSFNTRDTSILSSLPQYSMEHPTFLSSSLTTCLSPELEAYFDLIGSFPLDYDTSNFTRPVSVNRFPHLVDSTSPPLNSSDWCEMSKLNELKMIELEIFALESPSPLVNNLVHNCQYATGFQYNKFFITYYANTSGNHPKIFDLAYVCDSTSPNLIRISGHNFPPFYCFKSPSMALSIDASGRADIFFHLFRYPTKALCMDSLKGANYTDTCVELCMPNPTWVDPYCTIIFSNSTTVIRSCKPLK